jgi:hypothetical protein
MLTIKIALTLLIPLLFWLGGQFNHNIRRIPIPIILALYFAFTTAWWLFFAVGAGFGLTIPIGYGQPSPEDTKPSFLGKIFKIGWLIRGVYGAIVSAAGGLGLFLAGFLPFLFYIAYVLLNFSVGAILCKNKAKASFIEPMVGLGIASIVWLVRNAAH